MANSVEMPELGESVTEGTITQWLKSVGDTVEVDEPLLEVSTDKVDTEIPSPVAGTIIEIKADEDDTIEVGEVIAIIGDEDEADSPSNDSSADKGEEEEADTKEEPKGDSSNGGSGEAADVEMPELGESVTEGTITQWLKSVGDTVEVDEPLLEVSTDKVDTEIPSPVAGTLVEILADEDDTIEVGEVIARIGDENATASMPFGPPIRRRMKSPLSSTTTTDISLTTVSGSTKASTNTFPAAHCCKSCASSGRMVSPGPRGGRSDDLDLLRRKGLNIIP